MKIEIRGPAFVTLDDADDKLADPEVLSGLGGVAFSSDEIGNYLDIALVEIGVVGGRIRCNWELERGLEVVVDFWSPRSLLPSEIDSLENECLGQMSDGMGEGGFEFRSSGDCYRVTADWSRDEISTHQFDDGTAVAPAPHVAMSAMRGDIVALTELLDDGSDCNQTAQHMSALHWAILYQHPQAAMVLLGRGANPNALDREQQSPLMNCALSRMTDDESITVARALIQRGADRNYSKDGWSSLQYAENRKKHKLAAFLALPTIRLAGGTSSGCP